MNQGDENKNPSGAELLSPLDALARCPFCHAIPEPPYTNNVGETYARIRHQADCMLAIAAPRDQWLHSGVFEKWNTRPSAWQAIETAPQNYSWILGLTPNRRCVVVRWGGSHWEDDNQLFRDIRLWMPLPPAPEQKTEETK